MKSAAPYVAKSWPLFASSVKVAFLICGPMSRMPLDDEKVVISGQNVVAMRMFVCLSKKADTRRVCTLATTRAKWFGNGHTRRAPLTSVERRNGYSGLGGDMLVSRKRCPL